MKKLKVYFILFILIGLQGCLMYYPEKKYSIDESYNKEIENENCEILNFIDHKKREYNRTSKQNNIYYSDEEIKELFLPFIDLNNMEKYFNDYKYVLYICGCDDGSKFIRFNSEEKRNLFLDKAINFENFDDIFTYEEEEYFLFDWN